MGRFLSVASVQMEIIVGDTEANVSKMLQLAEGTFQDFPWINIICFSELVVTGFHPVKWKQQGEPIPGPTTNKFCELAKKYEKWIIPGSMVEKDGENFYNTSVLISPEGEIVAQYSKMHTWLPLEPFTPGKKFCVFDIPDVGRIGICICYDFWFPEVCRQLAWMGAEVIFHPTMTPASLGAQEQIIAQARALENHVYMVSTSGCGLHGGISLAGRSMIVDPDGRVLQEAGTAEMISTEILDLDKARLSAEYGTVGMIPMMKHLKHFNHTYPIYSEGIEHGELYKKLGPAPTIEEYAKTTHIRLPFKR